MSAQPFAGRRVLAIGSALPDLARGPLEGAIVETAGLDRLIGVGASDADLLIIEADSWGGPALAAGVQALALCPAPPPVTWPPRSPR